jgi:RNA-binding protein Musashi
MAAAAAQGGGGEEAAAAVGESRKLFVGGIPSGAQEGELREHFARFGEVRSVIVMRDRETGHGRGFGFVEFEDEADAAAALGDGSKPAHLICGRMVSEFRFEPVPPPDLRAPPVARVARGPVLLLTRGFSSFFACTKRW